MSLISLLPVKWLKSLIIPYSAVVIYFFNENSGNVIFSSDEIGILIVDLNNINFDDYNFDEDDCETTTGDRFMA